MRLSQIRLGVRVCRNADYREATAFRSNYPDQQPFADYLMQQRDGFIKFSELPAAGDWGAPYQRLA